MKTTWGEIKSQVLNLGYADSSDYTDHATKFPEAANYALVEIASYVRPIIKKYSISQYPLTNILANPADLFDVQAHTTSDISFSFTDGVSYYFECDGNGTAYIERENGSVISTITLTSSHSFKAYRGFIAQTGALRLRFTGNYAYNIRNIAVYSVKYSDTLADIPAYVPYNRYDMATLTADLTEGRVFLAFADDPILQSDFSVDQQYVKFRDYFIEQGTVLCLNSFFVGQFEVFYKAYPVKITSSTLDTYELDIDPDAARLVPYLMASRIWVEDDPVKSAQYYNIYQNAKSEVIATTPKYSNDVWTSYNGWC